MNASSPSARLTRASGTNFYYAFLILPRLKRRAIYALYSFCRVVDDCVDDESGEGEAGLTRWMDEIYRCYGGRPQTDLGRELMEALALFPIPRGCFEQIVAGCRMDLSARRFPTFADLRVYCELVASAVGLAAIEIFEYTDPRTCEYAVELGVALQLTNILRDVGADARRGRLYLPLEDLARFGVQEEELLAAHGAASGGVRRLLEYEADRARQQYRIARELLPAADRRAMTSAEIMAAVYRALLDEIVRRGFPLTGPRVGISRARKAWLALATWVRCRGRS